MLQETDTFYALVRTSIHNVNIPKEKTCNLDYCLLPTRFIYVLTRAIYCHVGLKWHSLLFGNNRKLFRVFAVVYSAVEYCILSHKRVFNCKNNKSKCLVQ